MHKKIQRLRQERGLSQRDLSRRMGKDCIVHISMIENGKRKNISLMTACQLAKAFGITLDELVAGTEFELEER